jgi:hypothetical protein
MHVTSGGQDDKRTQGAINGIVHHRRARARFMSSGVSSVLPDRGSVSIGRIGFESTLFLVVYAIAMGIILVSG